MNIDVRKIILTTIYTLAEKSDRRIINWDDIEIYITLLEKKFKTQINLIYEDGFNEEKYDKFIHCHVEYPNVYFILNTKYHFKQINKSIIDEQLILDSKECEDLINRNIDTNKLDEIITFVRNQSNTSYQERTSLDKTLKNHPPIKYIAFDGVFKIFMLYYSIVYKNSIEKETLKSAMMEIADLLKNQGIELEPINNLNLFRSAYDKNRNQNPDNPNRKFSLKDGYVNIKIENFDDFLLEIKGIFNKEILSFIEKIVAYYITSPEFESKITKRKSKEKTKDIK